MSLGLFPLPTLFQSLTPLRLLMAFPPPSIRLLLLSFSPLLLLSPILLPLLPLLSMSILLNTPVFRWTKLAWMVTMLLVLPLVPPLLFFLSFFLFLLFLLPSSSFPLFFLFLTFQTHFILSRSTESFKFPSLFLSLSSEGPSVYRFSSSILPKKYLISCLHSLFLKFLLHKVQEREILRRFPLFLFAMNSAVKMSCLLSLPPLSKKLLWKGSMFLFPPEKLFFHLCQHSVSSI